jgi:hypothetical protein
MIRTWIVFIILVIIFSLSSCKKEDAEFNSALNTIKRCSYYSNQIYVYII